MKRFLSTTAFVVSLAMLFILSPTQSLTAENPASNQPIKVLGVKINPTGLQTTWVDGLELQIENTSRKSIGYLLLHVDMRGTSVSVPVTFGQPSGTKNSAAPEPLAPGAKITLKPAKAVCDRMKEQARNRIPLAGDLQTNINVVVFSDRSAWKGGYLNYPDPNDSSRWIAAEDTTRVNFIRANFKPRSQPCFRYGGFTLLPCCDGNFVASANFISDPNGNSQPREAEACCGSGNCCSYTDIAPCS